MKNVEQVNGRKQKVVAGETRVALMVGGARNRRSQTGTKNTAKTMAHGGVEGGWSYGGGLTEM